MPAASGRFDFTEPMVVIRVICGLFYFPHSISKIVGFAGTVGFFTRAGFYPPEGFVVLSVIMELTCAIGLTLGLFPKYLGILSAGLMLVAGYATARVHGLSWFWAGHGVEYLVFWGGGLARGGPRRLEQEPRLLRFLRLAAAPGEGFLSGTGRF